MNNTFRCIEIIHAKFYSIISTNDMIFCFRIYNPSDFIVKESIPKLFKFDTSGNRSSMRGIQTARGFLSLSATNALTLMLELL